MLIGGNDFFFSFMENKMTFSKSSISLEREFQVLYDYEKNNFVDYSEKLNIKLLNLSYKYEVEK